MATTTNFGWTTPDDTDLVKDGAAAIRTLGSSIDTSLVDLNGGTTGQVLTKASNTDLDFSFTTPGAGGSIIHIATATFSASSSIDLSDIFSSTYENYFFIGNYTSTTDNDLNYRYRVPGADDSTSNYNRQDLTTNSTTLTGQRATGVDKGRIGPTRATGSRISVQGYFYAPFLAQTKHSQSQGSINSSTAIEQIFLTFGFNAATSFTGLTVFPGSGTVTGTLSIFGIKNS
jgi:hypothetical protein